jgi:hypothetical protein
MRGTEKQAVDAQKKFFKHIEGVEWHISKDVQEVREILEKMSPKK